jgi:hypothetical protein
MVRCVAARSAEERIVSRPNRGKPWAKHRACRRTRGIIQQGIIAETAASLLKMPEPELPLKRSFRRATAR